MVKNIPTALSLLMTMTHVVCVIVTEGMSSAPGSPVMEIAATRINHPDNAVENANVRKMSKSDSSHIPGLFLRHSSFP